MIDLGNSKMLDRKIYELPRLNSGISRTRDFSVKEYLMDRTQTLLIIIKSSFTKIGLSFVNFGYYFFSRSIKNVSLASFLLFLMESVVR